MSRVGKQPIAIPSGVDVNVGESSVTVKGPKGTLSQLIVSRVSVAVEGESIVVHRENDQKQSRANHGLMRSLLNNMVTGVSVGFTKILAVNGIGYRADVRGQVLVMNLGYSHPINFSIPATVNIVVDKKNNITVSGASKQLVGQVAADIRSFRKPDHYKGKGVRYIDEYVRIKAGKSA